MSIKLIVLVGTSEKGKTGTLKHVVRKLIENGANKVSDLPNNFKVMRANDTLDVIFKCGDISIELMYRKQRIGITTFGDDRNSIKEKIDLFIQDGCDCIVCASHPTGGSYNYIQELIATVDLQFYEIQKIGCTGEKDDWKYRNLCDFSDCLTANEIISYI